VNTKASIFILEPVACGKRRSIWHLTTELGTLAKFSGLASFELLQDDAFDI